MSTPRFSSIDTGSVSRDEWIFAGLGLLLLIDLLALPWFSFSFGPISLSLTATDAPDGWLAVLAVLAIVAAVADLGIERLAPTVVMPSVRGSRSETRLVLASIAALFVALKFLFHIHFQYFGFGFYAGILLTAGFVYIARRLSAA